MLAPGLPLAVDWAGLLEGDPRWPLALAFGVGAGIWLFFRGFGAWRHMRLIQDTPTSRVRSLALGRVEVHGRAEGKGELVAPFTGGPCVYYRWRIEEETGSGKNRRWSTLEHGSSESWPFYLQDDTGRVLVDPRGAEIDIPVDLREVNPPLVGPIGDFLEQRGIEPKGFLGMRRKLRFSEWHIGPGEDVYVLGVAQARASIAHERRTRITEKLSLLRSDPAAMAHFDLDGDGHVSGDEWEVARRLVVHEVELSGFDDPVVIAEEAGGNTPFTISDRSEPGLLRRLRWHAVGGVLGGAALALACLGGLFDKLNLF